MRKLDPDFYDEYIEIADADERKDFLISNFKPALISILLFLFLALDADAIVSLLFLGLKKHASRFI
jgi:hypothetical protein